CLILEVVEKISLNSTGRRSKGMLGYAASFHNMPNFPPTRLEIIGNECAMTSPPRRFRAHVSRTLLTRSMYKLTYPLPKLRGLHMVGISAKRAVTPGDVLRVRLRSSTSSQLR